MKQELTKKDLYILKLLLKQTNKIIEKEVKKQMSSININELVNEQLNKKQKNTNSIIKKEIDKQAKAMMIKHLKPIISELKKIKNKNTNTTNDLFKPVNNSQPINNKLKETLNDYRNLMEEQYAPPVNQPVSVNPGLPDTTVDHTSDPKEASLNVISAFLGGKHMGDFAKKYKSKTVVKDS